MSTYPVAKIMTSAVNMLPSSNLIPFSVNSEIKLSLFTLILPVTIAWLAP